jgi:hypothetical protein
MNENLNVLNNFTLRQFLSYLASENFFQIAAKINTANVLTELTTDKGLVYYLRPALGNCELQKGWERVSGV